MTVLFWFKVFSSFVEWFWDCVWRLGGVSFRLSLSVCPMGKSIRFVLRKLHEEFRSFRQWLGLYFSSLYGIFMTGVVLHVLNFSSRVYFVPSLCSKKEWWLLRDRPSEL